MLARARRQSAHGVVGIWHVFLHFIMGSAPSTTDLKPRCSDDDMPPPISEDWTCAPSNPADQVSGHSSRVLTMDAPAAETISPRDRIETEEIVADGSIWEAPAVVQALSHLVRHSFLLSQRRKQLQLMNANRANEMSKYISKRQLAQDSIMELVGTLLVHTESGPPPSFDGSQLLQDARELEEQSQTTMNVEFKAAILQSEIEKHESRLAQDLTSFLSHIPGGRALLDEQCTTDVEAISRSDSVSSESIPAAAQDYFEATGAYANLKDRIVDLDEEHGEEIRQRGLSDGWLQAVYDSDYEDKYRQARAALFQQTRDMRSRLESLSVQCKMEGIEIERFRRRRQHEFDDFNDDSTALSKAPVDAPLLEFCPEDYPPQGLAKAPTRVLSPSDEDFDILSPEEESDTHTGVHGWLRDLESPTPMVMNQDSFPLQLQTNESAGLKRSQSDGALFRSLGRSHGVRPQ